MTGVVYEGVSWPVTACCMAEEGEDTQHCICPPCERAVRAWAYGGTIPPMTAEQRRYLEDQVTSTEGYTKADVEGASERDLAHTVLSAWTDYCRDKGLL